jgi:hypothetical protein
MEESMVEQFLKDVESWKPDGKSPALYRAALKKGKTPDVHIEALAEGWLHAALASYRYLEAVHGLATTTKLDSKTFVQRLAQMVEAVESLKTGHAAYRKAFAVYHAEVQGGLVHARFDTLYYDAIQNFDVKGALKSVLQDVDLLLRSFSLVSAEMAGVRCLELYEDCVRFHLYGHYLLMRQPASLEECWSVLFDLDGLFGASGEGEAGADLEDLQMELEEVRRKNKGE